MIARELWLIETSPEFHDSISIAAKTNFDVAERSVRLRISAGSIANRGLPAGFLTGTCLISGTVLLCRLRLGNLTPLAQRPESDRIRIHGAPGADGFRAASFAHLAPPELHAGAVAPVAYLANPPAFLVNQ